MKTLPEILEQAISDSATDDLTTDWDAILVEAVEAIAKELMWVIGEYELNVQEGDSAKYSKEQLERLIPIRQRMNYLRAEQRARLTAFIGKGDTK